MWPALQPDKYRILIVTALAGFSGLLYYFFVFFSAPVSDLLALAYAYLAAGTLYFWDVLYEHTRVRRLFYFGAVLLCLCAYLFGTGTLAARLADARFSQLAANDISIKKVEVQKIESPPLKYPVGVSIGIEYETTAERPPSFAMLFLKYDANPLALGSLAQSMASEEQVLQSPESGAKSVILKYRLSFNGFEKDQCLRGSRKIPQLTGSARLSVDWNYTNHQTSHTEGFDTTQLNEILSQNATFQEIEKDLPEILAQFSEERLGEVGFYRCLKERVLGPCYCLRDGS